MNVSDKWMLEQMQQMAASMATSLPQTDQSQEAPKTEKGESFQDLMDKAKAQQTESPKQDGDSAKKTESTQSEKPVQKDGEVRKGGEARKVETVRNADGTEIQKVNLTVQEAALVAAGYAELSPVMPDGTVSLLIPVGDGIPENPVIDQILLGEAVTEASRDQSALLLDGEWVVEPAQELTAAVEQLFYKTGDLRSAEDILSGLEQKVQDAQTADTGSVMETVVKTANPEQSADMVQTEEQEEDGSGLSAEVMTAREPLFKDVKAAPVKVGENFQLDTQQPDMDDKLAETIRIAAETGLRQIEIKLSPENLGALTIRLTQSVDGTLQVVLHTANAKTANLLSQHLDGLNQALQGYGQNQEVRVEVQRNEDSQQADQQQHQQTDPDGRGQQSRQQQEQHQQDNGHSGDFVQKLRLGLFDTEN